MVYYHGKYEFEIPCYNCAECAFRYSFFVLFQQVLKTLVKNALNQVYLEERWCVLTKELIECFVKQFNGHLVSP